MMLTLLKKYIERIAYIHYLIQKKSTGSPVVFAKKIGLTKAQVSVYIRFLRSVGLKIVYIKSRETYSYDGETDLRFICGFVQNSPELNKSIKYSILKEKNRRA